MDRSAFAAMLVVCLALMSLQVFSQGKGVRPELLVKRNPILGSDSVLSKARGNFEDNCLPCHGEEGKGDGPLSSSLKTKPKDLTSSKELSGLTDGEIFWTITTGRDPMPAFDQKLTDEERWGLVHLLRRMSKTSPNTTPHHS